MKHPLSIHILYHRNNHDGQKLYADLYKLLCRDYKKPFDSGMGIPVYFYTNEDGAIRDIDTTLSDKTFVLLLVDQNMYLSDTWKRYINDNLLPKLERTNNIHLTSVSLYKYAFELNEKLGKYQFLSFNNESVYSHWNEFMMRLYDILVRYVDDKSKKQQTIFISHSKQDDDKYVLRLATGLRDYLLEKGTKLSSFFDVNNIMEGYNFEQQILDNVDSSIMVVIFSNAYSSREWCLKEILRAKKSQIPLIVVYAVNGDIDRTFPYIGNVPATQYRDDWTPVINLLLRTTLYHKYQRLLLDKLKGQDMEILPFAPDAYCLSYYKDKDKVYVLYPEPPLAWCEKEVLDSIKSTVASFVTPMLLTSEDIDLKKRNIAISISNTDDYYHKGIGQEMLNDVVVELLRHIFISNGHVVYGGNLAANGFMELFRSLSYQYGQYHRMHVENNGNDDNEQYVTSFVAWPYSELINSDQRCEYIHSRVNLIPLKLPDEAKVDGIDEVTKQKLALTSMRIQLEEYSSEDREGNRQPLLAHLFIGGKTTGSKGCKPGILEEFLIAKEHHHPIFLLGGFGGETEIIAKHISGENQTLADLEGLNFGDLNNGIDDENIQRNILTSTNITEIIPHILQALNKLAHGKKV